MNNKQLIVDIYNIVEIIFSRKRINESLCENEIEKEIEYLYNALTIMKGKIEDFAESNKKEVK